MNDTTKPRTPQPGDVWENGGKYYIAATVWNILGGDYVYMVRHTGMFHGTKKKTASANASRFRVDMALPKSWRYLGRASDLIGEALAARKETPND